MCIIYKIWIFYVNCHILDLYIMIYRFFIQIALFLIYITLGTILIFLENWFI